MYIHIYINIVLLRYVSTLAYCLMFCWANDKQDGNPDSFGSRSNITGGYRIDNGSSIKFRKGNRRSIAWNLFPLVVPFSLYLSFTYSYLLYQKVPFVQQILRVFIACRVILQAKSQAVKLAIILIYLQFNILLVHFYFF